MVVEKPYKEVIEDKYIIREFSGEVDESELVWHRDRQTREVTVLQGEGWKLQMDNRLPLELEKGKLYNIPKMEYHRIIKGKGNLLLQIWENDYD